MKNGLILSALLFTSSVHAYDFLCVTKEEAVNVAQENIEALRKELRDQSSFWIPRQKIREYVGRMDFNEHDKTYKTAYMAKWTCAPGSDCYVGIAVSCIGEASVYQFAD